LAVVTRIFSGVFIDMVHRTLLVSLALASGLIAIVEGPPVKTAELPSEQRQAIEGIIHDYLLHNPDVLIEALRGAEDKLNREADATAAEVLNDRRSEIFDDPATPVGGNPHGDATIVEFFDYRCPYCKQVLPALQTLLKEDHKLRFVYKEMPVLGPQSVTAAHAALAAQRQGKYEAFHNAMMATRGQITDETVYSVAGSVGLDLDRLKRDMNAPEIEQALKANLALAEALNIRGTPGFIVGNHIVPGAVELDSLRNMIADARKG
jgi:protein-disulfide isomerase